MVRARQILEGMGEGERPFQPTHVLPPRSRGEGATLNSSHNQVGSELKTRPPKPILKSKSEVKPQLTFTHSLRGRKKGQVDALPARNWLWQAGVSRGPSCCSDPSLLIVGIAVSNVENHLLGGLWDLQRGKQNWIFKKELFNLKNKFSHGLIDSQLVLSGSRTIQWVPAK